MDDKLDRVNANELDVMFMMCSEALSAEKLTFSLSEPPLSHTLGNDLTTFSILGPEQRLHLYPGEYSVVVG